MVSTNANDQTENVSKPTSKFPLTNLDNPTAKFACGICLFRLRSDWSSNELHSKTISLTR